MCTWAVELSGTIGVSDRRVARDGGGGGGAEANGVEEDKEAMMLLWLL